MKIRYKWKICLKNYFTSDFLKTEHYNLGWVVKVLNFKKLVAPMKKLRNSILENTTA